MGIESLDPQDRRWFVDNPEMLMQRYSDHTVIINRYQVIENIYKFCIEHDIHVRYPCNIVTNNHANYVIIPGIIGIGNITNLKHAFDNIVPVIIELLKYREKIYTFKEICSEIC